MALIDMTNANEENLSTMIKVLSNMLGTKRELHTQRLLYVYVVVFAFFLHKFTLKYQNFDLIALQMAVSRDTANSSKLYVKWQDCHR